MSLVVHIPNASIRPVSRLEGRIEDIREALLALFEDDDLSPEDLHVAMGVIQEVLAGWDSTLTPLPPPVDGETLPTS